MEIKAIDQKVKWEEFVDLVKPHTFLHSWAWGEFNERMGSQIYRLGVFDGENLLAVCLVFLVKAKRGSFLFCPHGPIFAEGVEHKEVLNLITTYLAAEAEKQHCAFIRFSPLVELKGTHQQDFLDLKYREAPIHMQHPELAWILDVAKPDDELLMNMRKTTRYCIRKAEKDGVEIVVSAKPEDLEKFWQVYAQTFDRQNFTPFSKEYLRNEFEVFAKDDRIRYFFAKYNDEIVAAAIIVFSKDSAFYHHGASVPKYSKVPAPYLLQWHVIQEARKRGCLWYNFWGIVGEDQPKHPWAGLSLFKRGFGGFAVEYVHAKDFVLTPKYWLNYLVETVRRKKRRL